MADIPTLEIGNEFIGNKFKAIQLWYRQSDTLPNLSSPD
jgi:hypothetical protein